MLKIRQLSVAYGETNIVRDVDLEVAPGKIVCLMGRNGVGKTTLLKATMGLLKSRGGSVSFEGRELTRTSPDVRARAGIGYVPEGRELFPGLTVLEELRLADRNGAGNIFDRCAWPEAAWKANRDGSIPLHGGEKHIRQLVLVFWNHVHEVRDGPKIANVEKAVVRRTVVGGKTSAIDAKDHRQVLQTHIVNNGIEGPLEERGVDGAERLHALGCHSGGKNDRMFFGDANIEECFSIGNWRTNANESAHGANQCGRRNEIGIAGRNSVVAAGEIMPKLMRQ